MNRRHLLACTALIPAAIVAGCTSAQVTSTLSTLAAGWAALPGLLSGAGVAIPTATSSQITTALNDLQTNAAAIGTAVAAPPTTVSQIVSDIELVSTLASPFFPAATPIGDLIGAGVSLIGTLLSEAGVAGVAGARSNTPKPTMSPASALAVLKTYAKK